jgi:hypothetical protein
MEFRDRLAVTNKLARAHLACVKQQYISRYNLRTSDKQVDIGDTVLILNPNMSSSRWWRAPATIFEIREDYSYLVETDRSRQWIQANKLRNCDVRVGEVVCESLFVNGNEDIEVAVDSLRVTYEKDEEFVEVEMLEFPNGGTDMKENFPSQKIDSSNLAHLNDRQHR